MREIKNFFNEKNKLNKGYSPNNDQSDVYYDFLNDNLPKPEILAEYESLKAGSVERFIKIIEDEQKHRHIVNNKALMLEAKYKQFGQICLVLIIAILSYASYAILERFTILPGVIFFLTSFATIATIVVRASAKTHYKKV